MTLGPRASPLRTCPIFCCSFVAISRGRYYNLSQGCENVKQGYYIDEHGTRVNINVPEDGVNLTESINSSRTLDLLLKQHNEQCKQNKRLFWISIVTSLVSIGALIVSIVALFQQSTSCGM